MDVPRTTILILTTRTGGGHMNLAQSLKEMLSSKYDVSIADPYPDILHNYYAALSRHFLRFWDAQYTYTNNKVMSQLLHHFMATRGRKRIAAVIEQHRPQLIISTHALLSYEIARVNKQLKKKIPLVFQLTDLEEVHISWFSEKHVDAYLAPTREICEQAVKQGVDRACLHVTGRPVRRQFWHVSPTERTETLTTLGLNPNVFTVFLQGGAKGSAGIDRTVKSILTAGVPVQIILAVGNNTTLATRFAQVERLRVLPFTELIAPYMAASDVIVGKAGASFLSEAFMLEKPFLVTTFIPGQEAPNLRFLERYNLGWVCLQTQALKQLITQIASTSSLMEDKIASIRAYKEWNIQANQKIPSIIEEVLAQ